MGDILKVSDNGLFRVRLELDEDCENPRKSQDNVVHVITLDTRVYNEIDKDAGPLGDAWTEAKLRWDDPRDMFMRWARAYHGAVMLLDIPNQGADAIWYLMPEGVAEVTDPAAALAGARDEYRAWAEGDAHGYVIEESVSYVERGGDRTRDDWEEVEDDSMWGLIGYDYAKETALAALAEHTKTGV